MTLPRLAHLLALSLALACDPAEVVPEVEEETPSIGEIANAETFKARNALDAAGCAKVSALQANPLRGAGDPGAVRWVALDFSACGPMGEIEPRLVWWETDGGLVLEALAPVVPDEYGCGIAAFPGAPIFGDPWTLQVWRGAYETEQMVSGLAEPDNGLTWVAAWESEDGVFFEAWLPTVAGCWSPLY